MYTGPSAGFADHDRDALGGEGAGHLEGNSAHDREPVDDAVHLTRAVVSVAHDTDEVDAAEAQLTSPACAMRTTSHIL